MKRIIIKEEECDGCKNCSLACMQAHRTNSGTLYDLNLTDLANESRNFILAVDSGYAPLFCRHCDEPECVRACISGAMTKDPESGIVSYDEEVCAKCFMCVMSCSFGILKPDRATSQKVVKCDFCAQDGYDPSCVKSCPKKAILIEEVTA
ncbi:MAG: 4Fe-4S dicluster domain-containing protein [Oscillospiraceae bacterium]|nr:4Fe-4S dicluster domain-containing protein [Oscillospiraceae bacterium]